MLRRQYPLDAAKSLQKIILPSVPTSTGLKPYLIAATLRSQSSVTEVPLAASLTATGERRLSWPASALGFGLESSATLSGAWSPVSGTPQVAGVQLTLTVPTTGTANFYRLKK